MIHLLRRRSEARRTNGKFGEEASTGLDAAAFIGTANLFFTGLVIMNLKTLPSIVHLSVVYLIISAVAFIISAIIFANVTGARDRAKFKAEMIQAGNWVSEYPGVYLFLIAIPLLILGVTDVFLVQITTAIVCYGGLLLYSMSPYSIDERRFQDGLDRIVNTTLLALFCGGTYLTAFLAPNYLLPLGILVLFALLITSYFSLSFKLTQDSQSN